MGRMLPQECDHGRVIGWGDFGGEDGSRPEPCPDCEARGKVRADWFERVLYGEVSTTAGHTHHNGACNCARTVASILQRMRNQPDMVYAWLARARQPQTVDSPEDAPAHSGQEGS